MKHLFRASLLLSLSLVSVGAHPQLGRTFPSEKKVITDPVTGTELVFLTSQQGMGDQKIYQTHNQWTADGKWVIFRSNRVKGEAMAVNEETGVIMQVTEGGYTGMLNVARNSMNLYYMRHDPKVKGAMQIVEVNLAQLFTDYENGKIKDRRHYERICGVTDPAIGAGGDMALDGSEKTAYFRIGRDYAAQFPIKEPISGTFGPRGMGAGPSGIAKMDLETGEVQHVVSVHFQVGHIQGNPWHDNEVIFCWETGGKAPTRMWMVNGDGSNLRPIYRETEYDWVTHEAVISENEIVFAIIGHRPIALDERQTDTSSDWGPSGTKEYATGIAVVDLRTRRFTLEGQVPGEGNFWHVAGTDDGNWVAGDDFERNLWVIDRHTKEVIKLSAGHKTTAADHVHPTFKSDGSCIEIQSAMLSEDGRSMNICLVKMPDDLLKRYSKVEQK